MGSRLLAAFVLIFLAACAPPAARQLNLYSASAETRLFANPIGFVFPEGVSLEHTFDRESGALLSADEARLVSRAVRVVAPGNAVTASAQVWRHAFVFYAEDGSPLGALAYCMECGAVAIVGPDDPNVSSDRLQHDGAAFNRIIESHGMMLEPELLE